MTAAMKVSDTVGHVAPDWTGHVLGDSYRVVRLVAMGGMGAVWEAEHLRLHKRVAVKVLLADIAGLPGAAERFRAEAEHVARLGHPHIVQILDFGTTDANEPYFVMEYLEGESLEARLERERPLRVADAIHITSQMASALAQTHKRGIVHRDLKPANVFLAHAEGEPNFVKLLDFGVSLAYRTAVAEGIPIGTPAYMAPEQVTGDVDIDHRADQFALAAVVYEMLTGCEAFPGEDPTEILDGVLRIDPPAPSSVARWLPATMDGVIARALEKRAVDRYPSVSRFAWALENAAQRAGMRRPSVLPPRSATPTPGSYRLVGAEAAPKEAERHRVPSPTETVPPPAAPDDTAAARQLLRAMSHADGAGDADGAVEAAEKLLAMASFGHDRNVVSVVGPALPAIQRVFEKRVGDDRNVLRPAARVLVERPRTLTPDAAKLLAAADGGATVGALVHRSGIPKQDAVRLLAGLLRRGLLERAG